MALSILAYKPTLLLLLIPMLLLTRRFRAVRIHIGVVMLILAATACGGMQIWPAYAHFLTILDGSPALTVIRSFGSGNM